MKKDILFLGQYFYPEHNSSATLPTDTARYLAEMGYQVDALVGYPREYCRERNVPTRENLDGIGIRRIRYVQLKRGSRLGRIINYLSFTVCALLRVFVLRRYKSVIVYSNPPLLPLVAVLGKLLFGTKIIFVAYDVYPEVAYASGNMKPGSMIDRGMRWINHLLYKNVSRVVALTEEMKAFLLENRPELTADRVVAIANWAHEKRSEADREAFEAFGYNEGQFVVSYFGNLGICQDVETLLAAAEQLRDEPKIRFLIVGHGTKMEYVQQRIRERQLHNVQLLGFLTGRKFEQAVAVSSCCVVTLEKGLKGMCAPSKFYSYLQGGKPVLAVVEDGSYLQEEILREKIGGAVTLGESDRLSEIIRQLSENTERCKEMGIRAQKLYDEQYAVEIGLGKYGQMLVEVLRG